MRLLILDNGRNSGGVETVAIHLLPALAGRLERVVWMLPEFARSQMAPRLRGCANLSLETTDQFGSGLYRLLGAVLRRLVLQTKIRTVRGAACAWLRRVQAVWISSFARSSGITHVLYLFTINQELPKLKLPSGIIVHDLNWRKYPQNWPGQSADDLDDELKGWIGYAGRIFAVSHFVRDEIMELEPSCGDKVVVVPWASSSCLGGQVNRSASAGFVAPAKPFVLYPAAVHAHKGHHLLLKAFELLASKGHDFDLVLTGGGTEGFASECALGAPWSEDCRTLLSSFSPAWQARVHALGRVTADELRELYSTCAVVVLPTEYEGFGLPLSEAVAWGARVVCSDIPPFKEQAELFGQSEDLTWFDPGNVMQLARCIESVIKNKSKSRENSGSAVHNAVSNKRSWPDVAECFITALRRIG